MSSATSAVLRALQRRPATSLTLLGGASVTSYACWLEVRADLEEQRYLKTFQLLQQQQQNENTYKEFLSSTSPCLPREYDYQSIHNYWTNRPVSTLKRFLKVFYELGPIAAGYIWDFRIYPSLMASANEGMVVKSQSLTDSMELKDVEDYKRQEKEAQLNYAKRLREALTNLGPAFVKAGQQLSIRPDLVPPSMLKELQKLCDSVRPIPDEVAFELIRKELKIDDLNDAFEDMKLVASASLGQVYQAKLKKQTSNSQNNKKKNANDQLPVVAIKVQRPDMRRTFSLDLFLLQKFGVLVDVFTSVFTNQPPFHEPLYESFARGSYSELDYEHEATSQEIFKEEFTKRNCPVTVPNVYREYTSEKVLTTEWINGINLTDASQDTIRKLIPVGVELFLTQLLDIGRFHSDPHGANLLVTPEGTLALIDFGLCAEVDEKSRRAMTKAIVHLIARDFDTLVENDSKELGFLPHDFDTAELKPLLTKILTVGLVEGGSDLRKRRRKLMEISNELNEVFFRYPFSVPPFFALVTRGLGVLEGIALSGDPEFDIFRASYPYARRRAVALLGRGTGVASFRASSPRVD